MIGKNDICYGAELYRRYNVWNYDLEKEQDDYIFEPEDRLNKLKEYYTQKDLNVKTIGEISDYLTYGLGINNMVIDDMHIEIGCLSVESELEIEELGESVSEKIYEVAEFVEEITYKVDESKLILEIR
jgi:hypothetical protein